MYSNRKILLYLPNLIKNIKILKFKHFIKIRNINNYILKEFITFVKFNKNDGTYLFL